MGTHGGPGITAQGQEEPERETQGDAEETPAGTPEADLFPACVRFDIVAFFFLCEDGPPQFGLSAGACL